MHNKAFDFTRFQLRRCSDDLVYRFVRVQRQDGSIAYLRTDNNKLSIEYDPHCGWIARDPDTKEVTGRPWNVFLVEEQDPDHPPQGEWVSKKRDKSYVYELVFTGQDNG